MALRAFYFIRALTKALTYYFIRALTKALTYYYINRSQRLLLAAIENNSVGVPIVVVVVIIVVLVNLPYADRGSFMKVLWLRKLKKTRILY